MRILLPLAALCWLAFAACDDDKETNHEFIIKTGRACGWCGGADSLVITKTTSHFSFDNPCDDTKDKDVKEQTDKTKWHDLLSSLNWNEFKEVDVHTCALCADGCDTWIWIQHNDTIHQIRFTDGSPEIAPIHTFVEKLGVLQEEFR